MLTDKLLPVPDTVVNRTFPEVIAPSPPLTTKLDAMLSSELPEAIFIAPAEETAEEPVPIKIDDDS
jgi:hypothetical protein